MSTDATKLLVSDVNIPLENVLDTKEPTENTGLIPKQETSNKTDLVVRKGINDITAKESCCKGISLKRSQIGSMALLIGSMVFLNILAFVFGGPIIGSGVSTFFFCILCCLYMKTIRGEQQESAQNRILVTE